MQIHITAGLIIAGLLTFRIIWGLIGSSTAQFHRFVRGPRAVIASVFPNRAGAAPQAQHPGHSPLGALSVVAMLCALVAQIGTGLFSDDEVFSNGPLARHVSTEFSAFATSIHEISGKIVMALVCLHIGAIVYYYFVQNKNLVLPMITGRKRLEPHQTQSFESVSLRGLAPALIAIVIAAALSLLLFSL